MITGTKVQGLQARLVGICRKGSEVKSQLCAFDVLSNMGRIFPSQIRDFWLSSGSNDGFGIKELIREFLTGGKYGNVAISK